MNSKDLVKTLAAGAMLLQLFTAIGCASVTVPTVDAPAAYREKLLRPSGADCTLHVRYIGNRTDDADPLFIAVNGVPTTALLYQPLAEALGQHMSATVQLVDLPGTGLSRLDNDEYTLQGQRDCLRAYLQRQPAHTLMVHDIAGPVLLPLLGEITPMRRVVVFNSLIKTAGYRFPFPLNCLRNCGPFARPLAYAAPFWFYEARLRFLGITHNDRVSRAALRAMYDDLSTMNGMGRLVDVLQNFNLGSETDQAIARGLAHDIPQLFIWGMRDPLLGGELEQLTESSQQREIHRLEQARHFPMLDFSAETATLISDWQRRQSH